MSDSLSCSGGFVECCAGCGPLSARDLAGRRRGHWLSGRFQRLRPPSLMPLPGCPLLPPRLGPPRTCFRGIERGTAGRPWTERSMRLPRRTYSLGSGDLARFVTNLTTRASQRHCVSSASAGEGCGLDCRWPNSSAASDSEIRRIPCSLCGGGRLLAVSSEGVDLGPLDRANAPEACEIGGLGRGCRCALEVTGRPSGADRR